MGQRSGIMVNRALWEYLTEEVTLQQMEEVDGVSPVDTWRRCIPGQREQEVQRPWGRESVFSVAGYLLGLWDTDSRK